MEPTNTPLNRRIYSPWYYNKFFRKIVGLILILLVIFLFSQISFLISPIISFFSSIFIPIAISFLFYYLLRPIIYQLSKLKVPRVLSIFLVYLVLAILLILFLAYLVPLMATQISALANTSVEAINQIQRAPTTFTIGPINLDLEKEIGERVIAFLQSITTAISKNIVDLLAFVTRVATILVSIPFILFYLLKEDHDFSTKFVQSMPEEYGKEVKKIIWNIDETLASYINGLVLVSLSIGTMLFLGYLMIGLNYALILAVLAFIFTTIPYVGPFLAITPALFVGFSQGSFMTLKVAIVFVIVQQIESNLVSPQIIGQRLNIHPLTIILLLLAAGTLYGLGGLILATPLYAILKVLIENLYKIYKLKSPKIKAQLTGS